MRGLGDVLGTFGNLVNLFISILFLLAIAVFFLGIIRYIFSSGNSERRKEGTQFMIYGVIALFVMVSVWGLVAFLQGTVFGVGMGEVEYIQGPFDELEIGL